MKILSTFNLALIALLPVLAWADTVTEAESGLAPEPVILANEIAPGKVLLGWLENIRVYPGGMLMKAKLDSGALSNAIHAENMLLFEKDGVSMVSFTILKDHDDPQSERVSLELPIERQVNIKLRYTPERDERPVVKLDFCIAGVRYTTLFSLTERADFNYPVLLGREFMRDYIIIDPSESFTHRTGCRRK